MDPLKWGWRVVGHALDDLGVPADAIEQRGHTVRLFLAEGIPTFVSVEPAPHGLDLFGYVRVEVTTIAAEGIDFLEALPTLENLNWSSAVGRWLWNSNGDISRTASVVGHPDVLGFLPTLLPGLTRITVADAIRSNRITEGQWRVTNGNRGGLWSQSEAIQWLYELIRKQAVGLPIESAMHRENQDASDDGRELWLSTDGRFEVAEAAFADFDDSGSDPLIVPTSGETVSGRFAGVFENPDYGKGSLVLLLIPKVLPDEYRWIGSNALNSFSETQPVLGLGAWSTEHWDDGRAFPRYTSFVPSYLIDALDEDERRSFALALARDALAQVRFVARTYRAFADGSHLQDARNRVSRALLTRRTAAAQTLMGAASKLDTGADTIAYVADAKLQVDAEWSIRSDHHLVWLPHHQKQTIASEPSSDDHPADRLMLETTVAEQSEAGVATDERINTFNESTWFSTLLRYEGGNVVLHTSYPTHAGNSWWLRDWFADLAVVQLVESDRLVGETLEGELDGWQATAHEISGRTRQHVDGIFKAIGMLRDHSERYADNFDTVMYAELDVLLERHVPEYDRGTSEGPNTRRYHLILHDSGIEAVVLFEPACHHLLGPSLRLTVSAADPLLGSAADAAVTNLVLAGTDLGLSVPVVAQDGELVGASIMPASATRGLKRESGAGLVFNLMATGSRALEFAVQHNR